MELCPKVTEEYTSSKINSILEAAQRVFIRKGFEAVSMQDIVDECRISRGGLYKYFSSTGEIFEAILNRDEYGEADGFSRLIEAGQDAFAILEAFMREQEKEILNITNTIIPTAYEYFIKSRRNNRRLEFLMKRYRRAQELLGRIIDYGMERKEFRRDVDKAEASKYILTFIEGLIITSIAVGIDGASLNSQVRLFSNTLHKLLAAE